MIGFAMPPFWIGLLLMVVFGLTLGWFPIPASARDSSAISITCSCRRLTIALFLAPILVQSLRSSMLDVLAADYIEVARAKGLSPTGASC